MAWLPDQDETLAGTTAPAPPKQRRQAATRLGDDAPVIAERLFKQAVAEGDFERASFAIVIMGRSRSTQTLEG